MDQINTASRLSLGNKIGYSFGTFGECIAYNFYYLFFIYFLTDFAGISPAAAGTISLLAVVWDAITDPLIGHLSDKSKNPKGRRRPWILRFCIPLGVMVVLLFTNVPLQGNAQFAYFVVMNILFWMAFTAVDIPYMVLGSEISRDHKERLSLRWMCTAFNYIGYGTAGYAMLLVFCFEGAFENSDLAWAVTAAIMAILIALAFYISYAATKGKEPENRESEQCGEQTALFRSIWEAMKIKPYRNILFYTLFAFTGIMLYTSAQVYLFDLILGASELAISNIYLVYAAMVVALSPLMSKIGIAIGNKRAMLYSIAISAVGFSAYLFIPLTMITVWGILLVCGIGVAGFFVNAYAVVYDIAEVASLKTKTNNEGVLVSFFSFIIKLGTALGMWLLGVVLEFYGYDPAALTERALDGVVVSGTIVPGVICAAAIVFVWKYKLSESDIIRLRNMKNKMEEIDQAEIERLL